MSSLNKALWNKDESFNVARRIKTFKKANARNKYFKKTYGISSDDYNKLWLKQQGCCAICDTHQSEFKRKLAVDHDHKTGKVRGLLCGRCNRGIGVFRDDPWYLECAIRYLEGNTEENTPLPLPLPTPEAKNAPETL